MKTPRKFTLALIFLSALGLGLWFSACDEAAELAKAVTDYTIENAKYPSNGSPGGIAVGSFEIANITKIVGLFDINWTVHASTDKTVDDADVLVAQGIVPGVSEEGVDISVGKSVEFMGKWPGSEGNYYLIITLEAEDDGKTKNNTDTSSAAIAVSGSGAAGSGIDYIISASSLPNGGKPGDPFEATITVKNDGTNNGGKDVYAALFISNDVAQDSNDFQIGSAIAAAVTAGGSSDVKISGNWPNDTTGDFYLIAIVSSEDDENINNNTSVSPAKVSISESNTGNEKIEGSTTYKSLARQGLFVAVGQWGTILKSTDGGSTWTSVGTEDTSNNYQDVADNGVDTFVAVGITSSGGGGALISKSTDKGATWTQVTGPGDYYTKLYGVTYDPATSRFITVGADSEIYYSADKGATWTAAASIDQSGLGLQDVDQNGSGTLIATAVNYHAVSKDGGATWTCYSNTGTNTYGITYGNGTWVAVSHFSKAVYSTDDGATWTAASVSGTLDDVVYGDNMFVISAHSGKVYSSPDGITWTAGTSGVTKILYGVSFNGSSGYAAVGASGTIIRSTDNGSTWSAVTSGTTNQLNGINK